MFGSGKQMRLGCSQLKVLEINWTNRVYVDLKPVFWPWVPLKVRCLIWKTRLYKIPGKRALIRCGVELDCDECSICFNEDETTDHVLLRCPFVLHLWHGISVWYGWRGIMGEKFRDRIDWHNNVTGNDNIKGMVAVILTFMVWFLWFARNECVYFQLDFSICG